MRLWKLAAMLIVAVLALAWGLSACGTTGDSCCVTCSTGCACGDSCIDCSKTCTRGAGCACNAH